MKLLSLALLIGCASPPQDDGVSVDEQLTSDGLLAANPEPLVDLVEDPRASLGLEAACPLIEVLAEDSGRREIWTGGCESTQSGPFYAAEVIRVTGSVEYWTGPDGAWIAGDRFTVHRDGVLDFYLDGAIELVEQGGLLLLDASGSFCGGPGPDCNDGLFTTDLSYGIYPASGYPSAYDVTVSGAVGTGDAVFALEGTWTIDLASCPDEPVQGALAIRADERQGLSLDGAFACDACADLVVQGVDAPAVCEIAL